MMIARSALCLMLLCAELTLDVAAYASTSPETESPGWANFVGLKSDIEMGTVDGTPMTINIALPKRKPTELSHGIVFIHGGGLIKGDKNDLNKRITAMAKRGFVAASVMYRLPPEHRFPAALEDVKLAIRFLKANAKALNLNPENITLSGASAGGYLAVLAGVTGNASGFSNHGLYAEYDASVSAVIAHAPPVADYTKEGYRAFPIVKRFLAPEHQTSLASLAAISPISYLDAEDPAFFFSHGTADKRVPVSMTQEFVQALRAQGHTVDYHEVSGGEHSLNASRPEQAKRVFRASIEFLRQTF